MVGFGLVCFFYKVRLRNSVLETSHLLPPACEVLASLKSQLQASLCCWFVSADEGCIFRALRRMLSHAGWAEGGHHDGWLSACGGVS